ncbi:MAG TPA: hypothetical protein VMJ72_00215 [Candidatus Paceibacterota bacterium]|nr:hypothetical protein [Candidatus Paceibacterota bacterium]
MDLWWRLRHWRARETDWSWYPLRRFKFGRDCKVPLAPYVKRYAAGRSQEAGRLQLALVEGKGYQEGFFTNPNQRFGKVYADGDYGFVLENVMPLADPVPLAVVTFDIREIHPDGSCVVIRQLQGIKHRREYLVGIRWERMLLAVVTDWARFHGYAGVACIRGKDSKWAYHCKASTLYLRYDVSARRNGFRYDETTLLWRLPLTGGGT